MPILTTKGALSAQGFGAFTAKATPPNIGHSFGGGYFAGKVSNAANTVADYYLIVAPKATGQTFVKYQDVAGLVTGASSNINGPNNTIILTGLSYPYSSPAALFCDGLTINGYSDWYLPAKNELEVMYYFLKPGTQPNNMSNGNNINAVPPEPYNTSYTSASPAQTSASLFVSGGSEAFYEDYYWSSTENNSTNAVAQSFFTGLQTNIWSKEAQLSVRAVRRVYV